MIDFGYGIQLDTLEKAQMAREWRNVKEIYQNCRQVGLISERHHQRWMESGDTETMFSVIVPDYDLARRNEGYVLCIGVAGLTNVHAIHGSAEISLYIAEDYHGIAAPGTAKHIIKTLIAHAFENMNLNRVFGDTFVTNTVELLNLQELGFITEGTLRQAYYKNGRYIDSVIQSILRSDYDKLKKGWE